MPVLTLGWERTLRIMIKLKTLPVPDNIVARKHGCSFCAKYLLSAPINLYFSFQSKKLAQTLASWWAILGNHWQTPDVEMGDKCQTYWFYASLKLVMGVRVCLWQSTKYITTIKPTEVLFMQTLFNTVGAIISNRSQTENQKSVT